MENTITYVKKTTFGKLFFGLIMLLLGIYTFLFSSFVAGAFCLGIALSVLSTEGSQIDIDNNRYRVIRSIFGLHFGKWQPCPEFDYISVFKTKEALQPSQLNNPVIKTNAVFVNLFFKNRKHITVYKSEDKKDAFKVADHFKLVFGVDILDATEREKIWL